MDGGQAATLGFRAPRCAPRGPKQWTARWLRWTPTESLALKTKGPMLHNYNHNYIRIPIHNYRYNYNHNHNHNHNHNYNYSVVRVW